MTNVDPPMMRQRKGRKRVAGLSNIKWRCERYNCNNIGNFHSYTLFFLQSPIASSYEKMIWDQELSINALAFAK